MALERSEEARAGAASRGSERRPLLPPSAAAERSAEPATNGHADPMDKQALAKLLYFHYKAYDPSFTWKDAIVLAVSLLSAAATLYLYIPYIHQAAHGRTALEAFWQLSGSASNIGVGTLAALMSINSFRDPLARHVRDAIGDKNSLLRKILKAIVIVPASALAAWPMANATIGALHRKMIVGAGQTVVNNFAFEKVVVEKQGRWLLDTFTCNQRHREFLLIVRALEHTMTQFVDRVIDSKNPVPEEFRPTEDPRGVKARFLQRSLGRRNNGLDYDHAPQLLQDVAKKIRSQNLKPFEDIGFWAWVSRRLLPGAVGGAAITIGLFGFVAKMYQDNAEHMHTSDINKLAATAGESAAWLNLAAYSGAQVGISLAATVLRDGKLPLAMRLYFWRTLAAMAFVGALTSGSYVTSTQLIATSPYFQKGGALSEYRDIAYYWAAFSAVLFNFEFNRQLTFHGIEQYGLQFGDPETKSRAHLAIATRNLLDDVKHRMNPEVLATVLLALDEADREALVNLLSYDESLSDLLHHILDPNYNATVRAATFSKLTPAARANEARGYGRAAAENDVGTYISKSPAARQRYGADPEAINADRPVRRPWSSYLPSCPTVSCKPVTNFFSHCGESAVFHPTQWKRAVSDCLGRGSNSYALPADSDDENPTETSGLGVGHS